MAKNANKNIRTMNKKVGNKEEIFIMALYNTIVCLLSGFTMQLWPPQSQKCCSIKDTDTGDEGDQRCGEMSFRAEMYQQRCQQAASSKSTRASCSLYLSCENPGAES